VPWTLFDFPVVRLQSKPCVLGPNETQTGEVQITFNPVPVGQLWRVERLAFRCRNPSGSIPELVAYDLPVPPPGTTPIAQGAPEFVPIPFSIVPVTGSRSGDFDSGDFASPITILGGTALTLAWQYVEAGVIAYARLQYALYEGTPAQPQPVAGATSARVGVPVDM
jgi:hypothetical protein